MSCLALTVLFWTRQSRRLDGSHWSHPTKRHVSVDGAVTVCGYDVPQDATVVAVTPQWHQFANCYNCAYRLWPDHAPPGLVRPANGSDFPPRAECPHLPGQGRDPLHCRQCTPPGPPPPTATPAAVAADRPAARRVPRDPGNPDPSVIRRWHIPNPYQSERCAVCGGRLAYGELINIEFEAGVIHAECPGPANPGRAGQPLPPY